MFWVWFYGIGKEHEWPTPHHLFPKKKKRYKERFIIVAEEVKNAIVAIHNTREQEKMLHKLVVEGVLKRRDNEGRALCRTLHKKKKQVV